MAKKTPKPTAASKNVKADPKAAVPVLDSTGATGQSELLLVDCTQDIAVLRQKHESVNRWVEAMEQILNRLNRKIEICRVDAATQSALDADQLGQFLWMIKNELTELFTQIDVGSLISEDLKHARAMFPPDVSGFARRTIETPSGSASQVDRGLVEALWQHAAAIIALINRGLGPARRYRDEIEQVLQMKQAAMVTVPKVRRRGGQTNDLIPARDNRIREIKEAHPAANNPELTKIVLNDPQIQTLGLRVSKDIVRDAVRQKAKINKRRK